MPHGERRRHIQVLLVTVLSLALIWLGGSLFVRHVVETAACPSPPTEDQRNLREDFVRSHIPDASRFDWTVEDCDDDGQAYLSFTTKVTAAEASKTFLSDPSCAPLRQQVAGASDLVSDVGGTVTLLFYPGEGQGGQTGVDLYLPLPGEE